MTAPELKPCPFCGGEAVALTGPVKTLWGVTCLRCACWMDDRADTADEAVAAWNRRADLAAVQPAQVLETCGKCMGSGYGGHPDSGQLCADCNGSGGVEPQPDTRDEVIARLVEALNREPTLIWIIENTSQVRIRDLAIDMLEQLRAVLVAAKAVLK